MPKGGGQCCWRSGTQLLAQWDPSCLSSSAAQTRMLSMLGSRVPCVTGSHTMQTSPHVHVPLLEACAGEVGAVLAGRHVAAQGGPFAVADFALDQAPPTHSHAQVHELVVPAHTPARMG